TISSINDPPIAADDVATTSVNRPVDIPVLANDTDPEGDTFSIQGTSTANGGTVLSNGQTVTYTPSANFLGTDRFTYTVIDEREASSSAFVDVTVAQTGNPPALVDDDFSTNEDTSVVLNVLANDQYAGVLNVVSVTNSPYATNVINVDNTVTMTPVGDVFGPMEFSYTVQADNGWYATANVRVLVISVNDPPVANDDRTVTATRPVTLDVLNNDTDIDGAAFTVIGVTNPANGTAVINADFSITYTPGAGFNNEDTFNYTLEDFGSATDVAQVRVAYNANCTGSNQHCDWDVSNGCETDTNIEDSDCGACGVRCHSQYACVGGTCVPNCPDGRLECDNQMGNGCEINGDTNAQHCGSCANACPPGQSCDAGSCAGCPSGYEDCDGDTGNGCEANLTADPGHCGGCDTACGTGEYCVSSTCDANCGTGTADCDNDVNNGCEVDTDVDTSHCGDCATACGSGESCDAGTCISGCPTGFEDCDGNTANGCEANLSG
ncbi:MAG: hypothetical protein COW42_11800, partial [Deltaproteobacteria bacterium CG17_big_fil_post_rev_8_21_14_2_50_63_7]